MKIGMWGVMSQVGVMWCGAGHLRTFPRTYLHLPAHARLVFPPIPSLLRHDQVSDQNSSDANKKYMRGRTAAAARSDGRASADGRMDGRGCGRRNGWSDRDHDVRLADLESKRPRRMSRRVAS